MKACFKQIRTGSGPDIWTETFHTHLKERGVESSVQFFPKYYEMTPQLLKIIDKHVDCDVIQSNTRDGFVFKQERTPLVVRATLNVHEHGFAEFKTPLQRLVHPLWKIYEGKSIEAADEVVYVSKYKMNSYQRTYGTDKGRIIYNGVDTSFFQPMDVEKGEYEGKTVLLFSGNFTKRKGSDILLEVMRELGDDYVLLCAGLREHIRRPERNIISLGRVGREHIRHYYNLADIFFFPSRLEGLSLSTLEAMACGLPVVTSNATSFPELIDDGRGGYLCNPDNIGEFKERIVSLAEDESVRERMGDHNRARAVKEFNMDNMVGEYIELYKKLI
ncbi:MAG: glycosyltransferase [Candidatus Altiarchaeales archaeon]|nr:glycosyltransferase [Candidatus Altiarchaeales archaeon]MBD3417285.1 glycosyltransferase [Candidatus Altiarchaeales archaeon]